MSGMPEDTPGAGEDFGLRVPQAAASQREAYRQLAYLFRREELVWLLNERYDAELTLWYLDVLRTGQGGSWIRQRYRYDAQAETVYYMGESPLSDAQFRAARAAGKPFPVAELQDALPER